MNATRSPFAPHAKKKYKAARKKAPKHPAAPEARMRHAVAQLFQRANKDILVHVMHIAPSHGEHTKLKAKMRQDAGDLPGPKNSIFEALWAHSLTLLHSSPFKRIMAEAAKKTTESATKQTEEAIPSAEDLDPNYSDDLDEFEERTMGAMSDFMEQALDNSSTILDEWDGEDLDELEESLQDKLDAGEGTAIGWVGVAFAALFGGAIKSAQLEAGVASAIWLTQQDSHVRPEHAALDGEEFDWDDPPLKAEDSSNGEDCFPGDDYNCRCVSSPVDPEDPDYDHAGRL